MSSYSSILFPTITAIVDTGSVSTEFTTSYVSSNQIFDWVTINTGNEVLVGEVYYRTTSSNWELASIISDDKAEAIGIVEQVTSITGSEYSAKIVYKGIIDFSNDPSIVLVPGLPYFLSFPTTSSGTSILRNTTIDEPLISKPIFVARSETEALVVNMRGLVNNSQSLISFPVVPDTHDCEVGNQIQTVYCETAEGSYTIQPNTIYGHNQGGANARAVSLVRGTLYQCDSSSLLTCLYGNALQTAYCENNGHSSSIEPDTIYASTQEEADSKALYYANLALVCIGNAEQIIYCPNSLAGYYVVPENTFFDQTQALADNSAILFAESQLECAVGNTGITLYCADNINSSSVAPNSFFASTLDQANASASNYASLHLICFFGNTIQTYNCPDGKSGSYTVAANKYYDYTQQEANANALAYAESQTTCLYGNVEETVYCLNADSGSLTIDPNPGENGTTDFTLSFTPISSSRNTVFTPSTAVSVNGIYYTGSFNSTVAINAASGSSSNIPSTITIVNTGTNVLSVNLYTAFTATINGNGTAIGNLHYQVDSDPINTILNTSYSSTGTTSLNETTSVAIGVGSTLVITFISTGTIGSNTISLISSLGFGLIVS